MTWAIKNTRTGELSPARFSSKEEAKRTLRNTIQKWFDLALVIEVVKVEKKGTA